MPFDRGYFNGAFCMLKKINMKAKFFYIPDLLLVINLEQVSSLQLSEPCKYSTNPQRCCIIVGKSVFWCDESNYHNIKELVL